MEGAITVQPLFHNLDGFDTYFKALRPDTNVRNPWFSEYWQEFFRSVFLLIQYCSAVKLFNGPLMYVDANSNWNHCPRASTQVITVSHANLGCISPTSAWPRPSFCSLSATQFTLTPTRCTINGRRSATGIRVSATRCATPTAAFSNFI